MDEIIWMKCDRLMKKQFFMGKFWRYDVIVKYMFIDSFYRNDKTTDFDCTSYDKLYKGISKNKRIKAEDFVPLILSFEKIGYDANYPINVGKKGRYLCGGSHRLACCLWFNIKKIPVVIHPKCTRKPERFSGSWMRKKGFTDSMGEIKKVKRKIFMRLGIIKHE
ncbi:MAG TPA: hypothetical protein VMX17_12200 [Candidatus Glassbacteria bacterium]|nr:hypothetical protein [Candidatus Glassbacteria bacterium]